MRHETAIFGQKTQIHKFQLSFFLGLFLLFQQQKTQKYAETPIFYSVLANLKKENFQKINLKQRNLENPIFAPFFSKKAIFRKLATNWTQKKNIK